MTWKPEDLQLAGKTIIVTGASSGIGLEAARIFSRQGANVIAAVRNMAKAEKVIDFKAEVAHLDLSDLSSVTSFAESVKAPVDILVNNAGVMAIPLARTKEGFEMQMGTNHFGHFVLTNLLLPRISERVVSVSSMVHYSGGINFKDINWEKSYKKWPAYAQSKLANLLFTKELQRLLEKSGSHIKATTAHPGYANTDLQKSGREETASHIAFANRIFAQSAYMGALPTVMAATADIPGDSFVGPRFGSRGWPQLVGRSKRAQSSDLAQRLWKVSEELTGVRFSL